MKTEQLKWTKENSWKNVSAAPLTESAQLVLVFGSTALLKGRGPIDELRTMYPGAEFIGCSTSGEILGTQVTDDTLVSTAIHFEKTKVVSKAMRMSDASDSFDAGEQLIREFDTRGLRHIFVLSDGLNVNGSELVRGMRGVLPEGVSVTGGLAGDGTLFTETLVLGNDADAQNKIITAIGFYGEDLRIGYGSFGGWDTFGIERLVTKSKNNVLYELDGQPALALYKSFLGDAQAKLLPSSGLLFPLSMRMEVDSQPVVRTILAIDEDNQSLTFAGDIPEGSYVRLMKANIDRLIDGAVEAANTTMGPLSEKAELAILISCVGRKLVLKQLVEEEVEGVRGILGDQAVMTGFYSYGEISPFSKDAKCELHNQTMTITTFSELAL